MKDLYLKLRMLRLYVFCGAGLVAWYTDVWKKDGDERLCCNGDMCGCYGACRYQEWEWALGRNKESEL